VEVVVNGKASFSYQDLGVWERPHLFVELDEFKDHQWSHFVLLLSTSEQAQPCRLESSRWNFGLQEVMMLLLMVINDE